MNTQVAIDPSRMTPKCNRPDSPCLTLYLALCMAQGLYYFLAGLWPLVSMETFLRVTGPKTDHLQSPAQALADHWLVNTVAVLVLAIGFVLVVAAWRRPPSIEAMLLALASAIGLTAIDCVYVARRVIDPIYLGDAAIQIGLIITWGVYYARERRFRRALALTEAQAEAAAAAEPARVLVTEPNCPQQPVGGRV